MSKINIEYTLDFCKSHPDMFYFVEDEDKNHPEILTCTGKCNKRKRSFYFNKAGEWQRKDKTYTYYSKQCLKCYDNEHNEYHCFICNTKIKNAWVNTHLKSKYHLLAVEKENIKNNLDSNNIFCAPCNVWMDKKFLARHKDSENHKLKIILLNNNDIDRKL